MDIKIVILRLQDRIGWLAMIDDVTVGHIFMTEEPNRTLKFMEAWVDEKYRRQGIFRQLWETRWSYVQDHYMDWTVYAWCMPKSLPLLLEKEFEEGETCVYVERKVTKNDADTKYSSS